MKVYAVLSDLDHTKEKKNHERNNMDPKKFNLTRHMTDVKLEPR